MEKKKVRGGKEYMGDVHVFSAEESQQPQTRCRWFVWPNHEFSCKKPFHNIYVERAVSLSTTPKYIHVHACSSGKFTSARTVTHMYVYM